jgi:hypothetical protein
VARRCTQHTLQQTRQRINLFAVVGLNALASVDLTPTNQTPMFVHASRQRDLLAHLCVCVRGGGVHVCVCACVCASVTPTTPDPPASPLSPPPLPPFPPLTIPLECPPDLPFLRTWVQTGTVSSILARSAFTARTLPPVEVDPTFTIRISPAPRRKGLRMGCVMGLRVGG